MVITIEPAVQLAGAARPTSLPSLDQLSEKSNNFDTLFVKAYVCDAGLTVKQHLVSSFCLPVIMCMGPVG